MIKNASKEDFLILAEMALKIWGNYSLDELKLEFEEIVDDPSSICLIKYIDDIPAGFANASLRCDYVEGTESSPVGYLEGIYVKDNYRLNGIGRELVEACEKWSNTKGCVEFASDCELTNTASLNFHLSLDFIEANRIICFKKDI